MFTATDFENVADDRLPGPLPDLPRIVPRFFVPFLQDKPQNPIMDNLKLEHGNRNLPSRLVLPRLEVPDEIAIMSLDMQGEEQERRVEDMWIAAATKEIGNSLRSWDRLRSSHINERLHTSFLSEQSEFIYMSARFSVQPRLHNPLQTISAVSQGELIASLRNTLMGISSRLHTWDPTIEKIVQVGTEGNALRIGILLVDGKDEVVSRSVVSRFLRIGTILRRLESLLASLRARSAREGPTIHALAHSLSTTLTFIRNSLIENSSIEQTPLLIEFWTRFEAYDDLLVSLAELYGREESLRPGQYLTLDSSPVPLLSRIYGQLSRHFERQSSPLIRAVIAFILTSTSNEYIHEVSLSIGYGGQPKIMSRKAESPHDVLDIDDEQNEEEDIFYLLDGIDADFPEFFPAPVLNALPAAQKSIALLQIAQPDHPMLVGGTGHKSIPTMRWLWTSEDISAAWNGLPLPQLLQVPIQEPPESAPIKSKAELLGFSTFDLEPGTWPPLSSLDVKDTSPAVLKVFIEHFPPSLPTITPTLNELTTLVFKDLMLHASKLSTALLSIFISSPGKLNLKSHLVLLRSFLLISAPPFKSRLSNALFSDTGEYEVDVTAHSMSIRSLRQQAGKPKRKIQDSKQPWAMGLSPNLLERETWPPVGADLSFFLRTVIVDSLDKGAETEDGTFKREDVIEEAEWRLGFAIKDLPTGPGRDKWLDPLCIEALDFLYMDYKPPRPLEILISPDILSKYQRMFAFLLRLLRVESALKSLFRISSHRSIAQFLFPTLSQSRKLLLHFRFIAQAFISALSGYVFDTAIRGNFDPFLARLADPSEAPPGDELEDVPLSSQGFSDVFELAKCHSILLDDILSACLLRSGQRGVGDLLRHSMELVLELTIVVGELHRGRIQEYQAAPMVEELYKKFCMKMIMLTKVLKGLVEKSPSSSKLALDSYSSGRARPTGGLEALYHLLVRLDLTEWWTKALRSEP